MSFTPKRSHPSGPAPMTVSVRRGLHEEGLAPEGLPRRRRPAAEEASTEEGSVPSGSIRELRPKRLLAGGRGTIPDGAARAHEPMTASAMPGAVPLPLVPGGETQRRKRLASRVDVRAAPHTGPPAVVASCTHRCVLACCCPLPRPLVCRPSPPRERVLCGRASPACLLTRRVGFLRPGLSPSVSQWPPPSLVGWRALVEVGELGRMAVVTPEPLGSSRGARQGARKLRGRKRVMRRVMTSGDREPPPANALGHRPAPALGPLRAVHVATEPARGLCVRSRCTGAGSGRREPSCVYGPFLDRSAHVRLALVAFDCATIELGRLSGPRRRSVHAACHGLPSCGTLRLWPAWHRELVGRSLLLAPAACYERGGDLVQQAPLLRAPHRARPCRRASRYERRSSVRSV